ncbi:hypothetical protein SAMN04488511_101402 [Pedobacter suwonensis]|uniref:Uncharacterized protein n=1 Tax=Pedobacter suwonensis TaxID=332999 RepID=A0A1I0SID4_9SPHI|nr:hypothetical protein [Pedobacter suwonensis]SFA39249.1 hypothetical protein SAMN04488511_101402 [Pedobacter suwonensis]
MLKFFNIVLIAIETNRERRNRNSGNILSSTCYAEFIEESLSQNNRFSNGENIKFGDVCHAQLDLSMGILML